MKPFVIYLCLCAVLAFGVLAVRLTDEDHAAAGVLSAATSIGFAVLMRKAEKWTF